MPCLLETPPAAAELRRQDGMRALPPRTVLRCGTSPCSWPLLLVAAVLAGAGSGRTGAGVAAWDFSSYSPEEALRLLQAATQKLEFDEGKLQLARKNEARDLKALLEDIRGVAQPRSLGVSRSALVDKGKIDTVRLKKDRQTVPILEAIVEEDKKNLAAAQSAYAQALGRSVGSPLGARGAEDGLTNGVGRASGWKTSSNTGEHGAAGADSGAHSAATDAVDGAAGAAGAGAPSAAGGATSAAGAAGAAADAADEASGEVGAMAGAAGDAVTGAIDDVTHFGDQSWLGRGAGHYVSCPPCTGTASPQEIADWLEGTMEGTEWLQSSEGIIWLSGPAGRAWLHTPQGAEWPFTQAGEIFLTSDWGRRFLESLAGQTWLSSPPGVRWLREHQPWAASILRVRNAATACLFSMCIAGVLAAYFTPIKNDDLVGWDGMGTNREYI